MFCLLLVEFGFDLLCWILWGLLELLSDDCLLLFDDLFVFVLLWYEVGILSCEIDGVWFCVGCVLLCFDDGWRGLVLEVGWGVEVEWLGLNCFLIMWFLGIREEELNFDIIDVMELEWVVGGLFVDFWDICLNFEISMKIGLLDCDFVGLDGLLWMLGFCIGLFGFDFDGDEFDFFCLFCEVDGFVGC